VVATTAVGANPQENVTTAVDEGIRLLEKTEYVTFVKNFAHPDDLKKILNDESITIEALAEKFANKNAKSLLTALKNVKTLGEPMYNEDKTKATWKLTVDDFPQETLVFEKQNGLWYLRN
ncbi:MAG: hypothetical protein NXI22_01295, partial [bacterium]|nr:hypothetical protein [bacterium]